MESEISHRPMTQTTIAPTILSPMLIRISDQYPILTFPIMSNPLRSPAPSLSRRGRSDGVPRCRQDCAPGSRRPQSRCHQGKDKGGRFELARVSRIVLNGVIIREEVSDPES